MFFAVSSVKELFESVENHILLLLLSKKHIFIINCNVCYFSFILALWPWFYTSFFIFVSSQPAPEVDRTPRGRVNQSDRGQKWRKYVHGVANLRSKYG